MYPYFYLKTGNGGFATHSIVTPLCNFTSSVINLYSGGCSITNTNDRLNLFCHVTDNTVISTGKPRVAVIAIKIGVRSLFLGETGVLDNIAIWKDFVSNLRQGELTSDTIHPSHESLKEPIMKFLTIMKDKGCGKNSNLCQRFIRWVTRCFA